MLEWWTTFCTSTVRSSQKPLWWSSSSRFRIFSKRGSILVHGRKHFHSFISMLVILVFYLMFKGGSAEPLEPPWICHWAHMLFFTGICTCAFSYYPINALLTHRVCFFCAWKCRCKILKISIWAPSQWAPLDFTFEHKMLFIFQAFFPLIETVTRGTICRMHM